MHEVPNMRLLPALAWELAGDPPAPRSTPASQAAAEIGRRNGFAGGGGRLTWLVLSRGLGTLRTYKRASWATRWSCFRSRGRGASLALLGEINAWSPPMKTGAGASLRTFQRLSMELDALPDTRRAPPLSLTIAASHDLALAALREALGRDRGLTLEALIHG